MGQKEQLSIETTYEIAKDFIELSYDRKASIGFQMGVFDNYTIDYTTQQLEDEIWNLTIRQEQFWELMRLIYEYYE